MTSFVQLPEGCLHVGSREQLSAQQIQLAEALAYHYGQTYDAYLLLDEGRQYFFGEDGMGVIGFSTWRRHAYVVGGLLTASENKAHLLDQFLKFCQRRKLSPKFFNLLPGERDMYRERGFLVSKTGEEPVIDLMETDWSGKRYQWVRRQENFCERSGVSSREVVIDQLDRQQRELLVDSLREISDEHVRSTAYGRELALTVGKVDFDWMYRRRLFVAEHERKPVAFLVANPAYSGGMWVVETYRKAADAPRGVIAYLIMQVSRKLQEEGVRFLSLCQVPSLRAADCPQNESPLVRRSMKLWWHYMPWFYDNPRQYHFKSRFRPKYRECLVATPPGSQLIPLTAFGWQWGVVMPDLRRVPGHMLTRIRKWSHSEQLADPYEEEVTLVNDLSTLLPEHGRRDPRLDILGFEQFDGAQSASCERSKSQQTVSMTSRELTTAGS